MKTYPKLAVNVARAFFSDNPSEALVSRMGNILCALAVRGGAVALPSGKHIGVSVLKAHLRYCMGTDARMETLDNTIGGFMTRNGVTVAEDRKYLDSVMYDLWTLDYEMYVVSRRAGQMAKSFMEHEAAL